MFVFILFTMNSCASRLVFRRWTERKWPKDSTEDSLVFVTSEPFLYLWLQVVKKGIPAVDKRHVVDSPLSRWDPVGDVGG